jgi:hypothetical protein
MDTSKIVELGTVTEETQDSEVIGGLDQLKYRD